MLNKNRSGKLARLKYLAALPLCAGMLCASTLVFSKDYGLIDLAPRQLQAAVKPALDSTRYALKLTDVKNNISGVSDKIVFTDPKNGVTTMYTLNTLTEKQVTDLKEKGYDMSVVERKNEFPDTIKRQLPPPPPPPAPRVKAPKVGKVPPPPVVVPDKPANAPKIDQIKFPPPVVKPDKPAKAPKVGKIKFPPPIVKQDKPTFSIGTPPATPDKPTFSIGTPPATPDKPTFSIGTPPAAAQINRRPPPPMPNDPTYSDLLNYVARHTRYPTAARDNKINGHVILNVTINSDHKIASATVEKGIGYGCDEEAARAIQTYTEVVNKAPGTYKFITTFTLAAENDTKFYSPKPIDSNIGSTKNLIGQVVVTSYL